jgi:predicted AAA+ superfamily ATPase
MFKRKINSEILNKYSGFVFGPRQIGKSTFLKQAFPKSPYFDLLLATEYAKFATKPQTLREELSALASIQQPIIIDEIQKVPALLDEVHWMMTNHGWRFVLCGSSARKLKRGGYNLLGGRAVYLSMFPLTFTEIEGFDLLRALNHGLIPNHYFDEDPNLLHRSYIATYLKEEIAAEAVVRNVPAFAKFLEASIFSNGEIPVYKNIAQDTGVNANTIKDYFQILEDTLLARFCPAFQKRPKRRVIESPKFYFFDVGLAGALIKRGQIEWGGESFGKAFEHFIFMELVAYSHYSGKEFPVNYWRTTSQLEVDFILGDHEVALEVKGTPAAKDKHFKGLKAFADEYKTRRSIVVSLDDKPRQVGDFLVLPWRDFLMRLWAGEII